MHFIYTYVLNAQCVVLVWFKQPISFKNSYLDVFRDLSGRKNHAGARGCDGCCSPTLPLGSPSFCPRDPPHLLWAGLRSWSRVVFLCLRTSLSCFCFWKIVSLGIELWVGMVCISCSVWTIFLLSLACLVSPAKSAFLLFVSVVSLSLVWSSLCVGPLSLCLCSGLRLYAFITFGTSLWHSCLPPRLPQGPQLHVTSASGSRPLLGAVLFSFKDWFSSPCAAADSFSLSSAHQTRSCRQKSSVHLIQYFSF